MDTTMSTAYFSTGEFGKMSMLMFFLLSVIEMAFIFAPKVFTDVLMHMMF